MKKATNPGMVLRRDYLVPLGMTQEHFAKRLGGTWTQSKINKTLNGQRAVTAEDALDFQDALGTDAKMWLDMQSEVNLAKAKETRVKIERIKYK